MFLYIKNKNSTEYNIQIRSVLTVSAIRNVRLAIEIHVGGKLIDYRCSVVDSIIVL